MAKETATRTNGTAAPSKTIVELSSIIQDNTARVNDYLESNGIGRLSFEAGSPDLSSLPPDIAACQEAVIEATDELQALMLGPMRTLTGTNIAFFPVFHALYRFRIATKFPPGDRVSFGQVAKAIGLNEADTKRLLRAAMTFRIFCEPESGFVAHSAISRTIATTPLLEQYLGHVCEETWRGNSHLVEAMLKWPGSEEPNETGLNIANGTDNAFFGEIGQDERRGKRFADVMAFMHSAGGFDRAALLEHYDWEACAVSGFGESSSMTVVDVGGSRGEMCIELARKFPRMRCVSQDLPEVSAKAQIPAELSDRVRSEGHDFFTEQPVRGADVYLLRWILHDWSDKYCLKILRNLTPALKRGARIVIEETCLPEPGTLSAYRERRLRSFDLSIKATLNGVERDAEDWRDLFSRADSRFAAPSITHLPGSKFSIIESRWSGDVGT